MQRRDSLFVLAGRTRYALFDQQFNSLPITVLSCNEDIVVWRGLNRVLLWRSQLSGRRVEHIACFFCDTGGRCGLVAVLRSKGFHGELKFTISESQVDMKLDSEELSLCNLATQMVSTKH